jgi:hypothetical protein
VLDGVGVGMGWGLGGVGKAAENDMAYGCIERRQDALLVWAAAPSPAFDAAMG